MERREFLKAGSILAVAGAVAGCSALRPGDDETPEETPTDEPVPEPTPETTPEPTPEPTPEEPPGEATPVETPGEESGIEFEYVVDAVDHLGMDPNGNTPVDNVLEWTLQVGGVLIQFPPGTYFWENELTVERTEKWGLQGQGAHPKDVAFISNSGEGKHLLTIRNGEDILLENLTLDYRHDRNSHLGLVVQVQDNLQIHDLHFQGFNPSRGDGGVINLSPQVLDSEGNATVTGLVRTGGSDIREHRHRTNNPNVPGIIWLGEKHSGGLTIRDSEFANAGENGIYASRTSGSVRIENCLFRNNNQAAVRISGEDSYVRNCEFVIDTENGHPDNEYPEGDYINPHAMMWESGTKDRSGARIEGCEIIYRTRPSNDRELQAVRGLGSIGDFEVRDTTFQIETDDTVAILGEDPDNSSFGAPASSPWNVTVNSVEIVGSGDATGGAIRLVNRPNSLIQASCLQLEGQQDGVLILDSGGCRIEDTNIWTNGEETVFVDAEVETNNLTYDNSCS